MVNGQKLAVEATKKILENLRGSDWYASAGSNAHRDLTGYALDIAVDIAQVYEGRKPTHEEFCGMRDALREYTPDTSDTAC